MTIDAQPDDEAVHRESGTCNKLPTQSPFHAPKKLVYGVLPSPWA